MPARENVERYLLEILRRSRSVRKRADELLARTYPSESPAQFAQVIRKISEALGKAATSIFSSLDFSAGDEPDLRPLQSVDFFILDIGAQLRYVDAARVHRLPWGGLPAFERWASAILPDIDIMLRPKWKYSYTFNLEDLRYAYYHRLKAFSDWLDPAEVLAEFKRPFHIISFPSLEQDNVLLHGLVGHELGHVLAARYLLKNPAHIDRFVEKSRKPLATAIQGTSRQRQLKIPGGDQRIARELKYLGAIWTRWMQELISDLAGALLLGPANLFSTFEYATRYDLDVVRELYPPWRYRLRRLLEFMSRRRYFPVNKVLFKGPGWDARQQRLVKTVQFVIDVANRQDVLSEKPRDLVKLDSDRYFRSRNPSARLGQEPRSRSSSSWLGASEGRSQLEEPCPCGCREASTGSRGISLQTPRDPGSTIKPPCRFHRS